VGERAKAVGGDRRPCGRWLGSRREAIEEGGEAGFEVLELFEEEPILFEGGVPAVVFDVLGDGQEERAGVVLVEGDGVVVHGGLSFACGGSAPGSVGGGFVVDVDGGFVGGEEELVARGEDPAALHPGGDGLVAFTVGEDEHAIPATTVLGIVEDAGGSVEVGAAAADALGFDLGAFAPLEGVLEVGGAVEGEDGDGHLLGEGGKFREEGGELGVVDGAGLVDGDEELGDVAALHAGVDVGEAFVDAFDGGGAFAAGE